MNTQEAKAEFETQMDYAAEEIGSKMYRLFY